MHLLNEVDLSHECIINEHEMIEFTTKARAQQASPIDFEALQPVFAWLPVDIIGDAGNFRNLHCLACHMQGKFSLVTRLTMFLSRDKHNLTNVFVQQCQSSKHEMITICGPMHMCNLKPMTLRTNVCL